MQQLLPMKRASFVVARSKCCRFSVRAKTQALCSLGLIAVFALSGDARGRPKTVDGLYALKLTSLHLREGKRWRRRTNGNIELSLRDGQAELRYRLSVEHSGRANAITYRNRLTGTFRGRHGTTRITLCGPAGSVLSSTYRGPC
jgi:hypothetical protein